MAALHTMKHGKRHSCLDDKLLKHSGIFHRFLPHRPRYVFVPVSLTFLFVPSLALIFLLLRLLMSLKKGWMKYID
jgi:hypothetical protein